MSDETKRNWIVGSVIGTVVIVVGAAAAFMFVPRGSDAVAQAAPAANPDKPNEYIASDEFKELPVKDQMKYFRDNRDRIDREKAGQLFRARMEEVVDTWYGLPEDKRTAYLDERIDEWEEMRDEMEKQREEDRRRRAEDGEDEENDQQAEHPDGRERPSRGEIRKHIRERTEGTSPEQRAKMMAFFQAMQARRAARGMDSGWGPRGH